MKRQNGSGTDLLPGRDCLGHTCGTNIDTEGVRFTNQQPNLIYTDKVFSFNKDTASPILFPINTGGNFADLYITELFLDGSCFFPCTLSPNAVFEIDNSFVVVEYFNTRPPGSIAASQVTLDGFSVDSVSFANGQYTARTQNVLSRVQKDRCLDRGLPTKAFFLISNAGPWDFRATFVLEGTVNTNGRCCRFRAEISNAPEAPNTMLPAGSVSSFAVPDLSLPCSIHGIAPDILFQFGAKINLVNPRLNVTCTNLGNACTVFLESAIAVEPVVHVQSVRRTLFCVNACEGLQPCDGSVRAAEIAADREDCEIGGVDRPDCVCRNDRGGRNTDCREDSVGGASDRGKNSVGGASDRGKSSVNRIGNNTTSPIADIIGAGNQDIGGITVGAGSCNDCVWGEARGHNCRPCRDDEDNVEGIRRHGKGDIAGARDCDRFRRGSRENVFGISDKAFLKRLLEEISEELSENTCDVAGTGYGPDGTYGIGDEEDPGVSERIRDTKKTTSRLRGCNGCSW
ncbi:MAG: hypothetical protein PHC91_07880 [Eubacteriales bacterium]|nr:hypothetical protein [Eubacteriales bacterium]